ncbi:MAG TPA: hypothetical protein EYP22_05130 [Methanosarcinales archaeon]|nr:hypothetical protein [Methanosarcinales archaeon]
MSLSEIRKVGLEALVQSLGQIGMLRFLQQFEVGRGDYTKEREQWLSKMSIQDIAKGIEEQRSKKK